MKTSPGTVALVAVASSLVTVAALELLRGVRPVPERAQASEVPATSDRPTVREVEPPATSSASELSPTGDEERLDELERRIAALELVVSSRRAAAPAPTAGDGEPTEAEDLRTLVLDWIAEERETRARAQEREAEEAKRKQQEFGARYQAFMLAQEHDLADWEQERLYEVFLATRIREAEVLELVAGMDDPAEVEARWVEFDEWVDQLERDGMGQELWDKLATDE